MLRTKVILSEVTNLSDARYASGMGVDYIGFSANPANNTYLAIDKIKEIATWLSGVMFIGNIGESIPENFEQDNFELIQTSNPPLINSFKNPVLLLDATKEEISEIEEAIINNSSAVSFFIIKISAETLKKNETQLKELCRAHSIFISTDFDETNVTSILDDLNPEGIVLYGSSEDKPGLSSYEGIADILENLETD
ncbi:MAG: hypothetical protein ABFS32_18365 [Bacteroidota bacterium]